jgi:hypothetical protein
VIVGIADLLESDHGWSTEQSEAHQGLTPR